MIDCNSPALHPRWECGGSPDEIVNRQLGTGFEIELESDEKSKLEILDSFDRRILRADRALLRVRGRFELVQSRDLASDAVRGTAARKRNKRWFWYDFEEEALRDGLAPLLKLRAATPLVAAELRSRSLALRNSDRKIVVRLRWQELRVGDRKLAPLLSLVSLIGYEAEAEQVQRALNDAGEELRPTQRSLASLLLEAADLERPPASSKDPVPLDHDPTVHAAVDSISLFLLQVARQNEPGLLADIDTEFLHDYRVALRQLRSLLQLVRGAYDESEHKALRATFGDFARTTNRLRDLDVHLLEREDFRERVPEPLRSGLDPVFADFERERDRELRRVKRMLRSEVYRQTVERACERFEKGNIRPGERAKSSIRQVATHEIRRHHRKVLRRGRALTPEMPDAEIHELRIECKRLRYLLEIFASLLPAAPHEKLLRRLKRLQDVLGRFNDNAVQQRSLLHYLSEHEHLERKAAAAVGALVATLHALELEARAGLIDSFRSFDRPSTRRWMLELAPPEQDARP